MASSLALPLFEFAPWEISRAFLVAHSFSSATFFMKFHLEEKLSAPAQD
jgi:hypothetical protein